MVSATTYEHYPQDGTTGLTSKLKDSALAGPAAPQAPPAAAAPQPAAAQSAPAPAQQRTAAKPAPPPPAAAEPRRVRFSVGSKYAVQDVIGEGAYGVVCSAIHRPSGQKVAIKKIAPFDHSMFCLRTLRELKLLRYFAENNVSENIISIVDIIKPTSLESFKEVYLIQELMETDLHRVIRTQNLSDDHCQYFAYQTLRALKALHSADVVHRDLKPSNLLLNANCDLKVCDFGLARSTQTAEPNGGETGFMTEYVATRWYRAPEIMLTFKQYTTKIDIWSVGCILAEMLSGRPLFPGRDYHHQLTLILDVLGTPTLDEFYAINSRRSRDYLRALPFRKKRDFATLFPNASAQAVDFLNKTLTFDPKKRMSVEECLAHPYLANYHDPDDEPVAPPLEPTFFDFDLQKDTITREELKKLLYDEIMQFKSLA
ncbi:CMGC/MAPK protein kinase [Pseudohyphozyma bogoriensis]|nr:CMGC/MAPK protein kinase [Pseudohyphozyma bogoriensis]